MKRNVPMSGFLIGLIMPLLGFLVVYLIMRNGMSVGSFLSYLNNDHKTLALVISLSCLANIIPFIFFNSRRMDLAARGVFIATMLYAVAMVLIKFVW